MAKKVAILGGTGKMGQWFAKYFRDKGFEVIISGRFPEKSARIAKGLGVDYTKSDFEAVHDASVVVVATPIEVTAKIILEVSSHIRKDAILFDIASIKGDIITALEEAANMGARALSVHPLFGPGASSVSGKRFLIIPINKDLQVVKEVLQMFEGDGGVVYLIESGEAHDRMMALTLALPHFLNIVFGKVLAGRDIEEVKKLGGTTFTLQLLLAESVLSEDPSLYYEIQSQNPAFPDILKDFSTAVNEAASLTKKKDKIGFIKNFEEVRSSLSKDSEFSKAYQRFYKAIEAIK